LQQIDNMMYVLEAHGSVFKQRRHTIDHSGVLDVNLPIPLNMSTFNLRLLRCIRSLLPKCEVELDDPEHTRHKILFASGQVYDFRSGRFEENAPEHRLYFRSPWKPTEFKSAGAVEEVCQDIYDFYSAGGEYFIEDERLLGDAQSEKGKAIARKLDAMSNLETCPLLHYLYGPDPDWDSIIYKLRYATRMACAHNWFTEALALVGPKGSAKDFLVKLLMVLFGTGELGYVSEIPSMYFTKPAAASAEGATPFLFNCLGRRLLVLAECPDVEWESACFKPFVEQGGARMPARANYAKKGDKMGVVLMGALVISSNQMIVCKKKNDSAFQDRLTQINHTRRFVAKPRPGTLQLKCDPSMKELPSSGVLNAELFCWIMNLYKTLESHICLERRIMPQPKSAIQNFKQLDEESVQNSLTKWLVKFCEFSSNREDASPEKDVKECVKTVTQMRHVGNLLSGMDIIHEKYKKKDGTRVMAWTDHPDYPGIEKWIILTDKAKQCRTYE
jgi:hypothetical protein